MIIIFSKKKKKIKISKNHASISKLEAFGHASSTKKKNQDLQKHTSNSKLGVFDYASFR